MRRVILVLLCGCRPAAPSTMAIEPSPAVAQGEPSTSAVAARPEPTPEPQPPPEPEPLPEARPRVEVAGSLGPAHPGPPAKELSESTCAKHEGRVRHRIASLSRRCSTAEDCELRTSFCPFGCYHVLAKDADRSAAEQALSRYLRDCKPCKYKCAPKPEALACVDGACVDLHEATDDADRRPPTVKEILDGQRREQP